jgi:uncharacterized membrane protein YqjE
MSHVNASASHTEGPTPTTSELIHRLSSQTARLVRDEIRLAQTELRIGTRRAGRGAGFAGVAGVLAVLGAAAATAAAVAALALVWPVWLSALVVSVVLFAVAGVVAMFAKREVEHVVPPLEESMGSVRADVEAIGESRHGGI